MGRLAHDTIAEAFSGIELTANTVERIVVALRKAGLDYVTIEAHAVTVYDDGQVIPFSAEDYIAHDLIECDFVPVDSVPATLIESIYIHMCEFKLSFMRFDEPEPRWPIYDALLSRLSRHVFA